MSAELRVLAAGDRFVLSELFAEAARDAAGAADITAYDMAWPDLPFGRVGEVDEASGDEDELITALQDRTAILTQLAPITERVLEASPTLRFIGVCRGGPVNVNVDAAKRHGVTVVNAPGRNSTATAEMAVGLMLAATRRIGQSHLALQSGQWPGAMYRFEQTGLEIEGAVVGLLGFGAVGSKVAVIARALGAEVVVFDPFVDPARVTGVGARLVGDVDDLFREADVLSVHARLTPETRYIVDARRLGLMRQGSFLVNSARGELIDYDATLDAVDSGRLGGVGLDVFPTEPVDFEHRLFTAIEAGANIVTTPHIAGASQGVARRAARIVAEELGRWHRGEALLHEL